MSYMETINQAALQVKCPYCMSLPGVWCRTKTGQYANWMHGPRTRPFQDVYMVGYDEGILEEREMAARRAKREAAAVGA